MGNEECDIIKLNGLIRKNCDIIRKDCSYARAYEKCLIQIENAKECIDLRKNEIVDLKSKINANRKAIEILLKMIDEKNSAIERARGEIERCNEKINERQNRIMLMICTPSDEDRWKVLTKQLSLTLLNMFKYSEDIMSMEMGFDSVHRTQVEEQWSQFRME